ncbi:NFX1-type zinc finger-containing protein 1 [Geodia barretti]|uniref:NFX1-type zinc finger-containing protein 1 n=1 Tax=Geodia barretti TaxID=519541 RepID=A0AA35X8E3_GEOBA|nr:NFX1-type zinc finger-containing protein 1 [Geodia barretti]
MLETFPQPAILATIKAFNRSGKDVKKLEKDCVELGQQFDLARDQLLSRTTPTNTSAEDEDNKEPPESFTTISIIPQNEDLVGGHKPFLRPNKVKGPYKGWDHYLDVQFRLLREDFIAPLREGINEHSSEHQSRGIRFREGPIFFATVVKRDTKQLEEGRLIVKFEGNTSGFNIDPDDEYTMVESTAYFEAYRHVLLALQHASLLKDTMPFKRYIVDCKLHDPSPPLYIRRYNAPGFNLAKVLKCEEADNINVTDEKSWPDCRRTCFDMSQYRALKMAMRQEISCIQGPPGTGKTFIGLKIVQTLLQNRSGWDPEKNSPILLVCYTNHALDQFLEEIIDSSSSDGLSPPNIVRIGGRCKSTKLANFVLATIARRHCYLYICAAKVKHFAEK